MLRDPRLYLGDIVDAISKILRWTDGLTLETFEAEEMVFDAVLRNLEIIGEAVRNLPKDLTDAHPQIDWRAIGGFRNRLAHAYFSVDPVIVWNVIRRRLPGLGDEIARILENLGPIVDG